MEHAQNTNAIYAAALEGIKFPADRNQLVEQAKRNGAEKSVIDVLSKMPNDDTYNNMPDVFKNTHIGIEGASTTASRSTSTKR